VYLFKGGANLTAWKPQDASGTAQPGLDQTGLDTDGNEFGDEFGAALAVGDFDTDGRVDLAVGAPGDTTGGKTFVFRGAATGPVAWANANQAGVQMGGQVNMTGAAGVPQSGERYGESLAAGDFDADGDTDLAIGASGDVRGTAGRTGSVYLLVAGGSQLTPGPILGQAGLDTDERGDRFGAWVAAGDFDADGKRDLAVGAPGERPGTGPQSGMVYVFRGAGGGPTPAQALDQGQMGTNEAGDLFGHALASGDFNQDGKTDLAIGAPGEAPGPDPRSGYVFLYNGASGNMVAREGLGQGN
jgi:hypothetical protein